MRSAVHQLKYRNLRAIATPLSKLLADYFYVNPVPADLMIPVPLHRKRLRERGYNQSELLAKEMSKLVGIPVKTDSLMRLKYTNSQAQSPSLTERRSNLDDAFTCGNNVLENKKILLIDDVATSGATLNACASALKKAGAGSVWGLTLARDYVK
jgi:ComF family protein